MYSMKKESVRKQFLEKRKQITPSKRREWSRQIEDRILRYVKEKNVSTVMAYSAFRQEVETEGLIRKLLAEGVTVALPKCYGQGRMEAYAIRHFEELVSGRFGILEPPERELLEPESIEMVLVPGCAFGRDMSRLGYGAGYYDLFLPQCKNAVFVGICYEFCLEESLPTDEFDVPMHCVITEKNVMNNL